MINQDKPNTGTPETYLNIGDSFSLIVGGTFKLIIGALGLGGMTNSAKASIGTTWSSIATTWASETQNWEESSQLISNKSRIENNSYQISSITFSPETMTAGATSLVLTDDSYSSAISLPFAFHYFDKIMNSIFIGSNGLVGFSPGGMESYDIVALPTLGFPSGQIYGYWNDLEPERGGTIKYETMGVVGSRKFVIEYRDIHEFNKSDVVSTFQIMLYEESNNIEIHAASANSSVFRFNVQGIESPDGTTAFVYPGRNYVRFTLTNDAVQFSRTLFITNQPKP